MTIFATATATPTIIITPTQSKIVSAFLSQLLLFLILPETGLLMGNGSAMTLGSNIGTRKSQWQLVDYLQRTRAFTKDAVRNVLLSVDRAHFAPNYPYEDRPQSIGYGATISAPHMHAAALEHLVDVIDEDSHILDVGSGSGYLAVCFAKLIGPRGKVVGIEHIEELVHLSIRNVRKNYSELLDSDRLKLVVGDGRNGWPQEAPYQAIHVGAAAPEVPKPLIDQLAIGGRMVIPVGTYNQKFLQIDKLANGEITRRHLADVIYVPLTSKSNQIGSGRDGSL